MKVENKGKIIKELVKEDLDEDPNESSKYPASYFDGPLEPNPRENQGAGQDESVEGNF